MRQHRARTAAAGADGKVDLGKGGALEDNLVRAALIGDGDERQRAGLHCARPVELGRGLVGGHGVLVVHVGRGRRRGQGQAARGQARVELGALGEGRPALAPEAGGDALDGADDGLVAGKVLGQRDEVDVDALNHPPGVGRKKRRGEKRRGEKWRMGRLGQRRLGQERLGLLRHQQRGSRQESVRILLLHRPRVADPGMGRPDTRRSVAADGRVLLVV